MKKQAGFTAIELVVSFIVLVTLAVFFVIQRGNMETAARDQTRKTAVNAMYYGLTEVYYQQNKYYPKWMFCVSLHFERHVTVLLIFELLLFFC